MDTPTAVVPLAVVPRELLERALGATRALEAWLQNARIYQSPEVKTLIADLEAALAAAPHRDEHA